MPVLNDRAVKALASKPDRYTVFDTACPGLFIEVLPSGIKTWRTRVIEHGKRRVVTIGRYGDLSLKEAREYVIELRKRYRNAKYRDVPVESKEVTFGEAAKQWLASRTHIWTPGHAKETESRLERNVLPWLGDKPVRSITSADVLAVARRVEERTAYELAHRCVQIIGAVMRYGIASGLCENDPSVAVHGALSPVQVKHMAAITNPDEVGALIRAIRGYRGEFIVASALKFLVLTFVRPGELRRVEWSEVNTSTAEWRQPPDKQKVKGRPDHIVPLSRQAVAILTEIRPKTGHEKYVFSGFNGRPLSENTLNTALRRLGYSKDEMCSHGFRSMASSLINESGKFSPDVIEKELNHVPRNAVRAAYNRAQYLAERREMMQWYADELDRLASQGVVVHLAGNAATG